MRFILLAPLLLAAVPAAAQVELLDQIAPEAGRGQVQVTTAPGGESVQLMSGVSDLLALGGSLEFEDGVLEEASASAMFRFSEPDEGPLGVAVELTGSLARGGSLRNLEARLILERQSDTWWVQGTGIVRNSREGDERGTGLAYVGSLQRKLAGAWLGVETSGRFARLSGSGEVFGTGQYYAGPSLTLEQGLGEKDLEVGLSWQQRLKGKGARSGPRIYAQFTF
ncbi:hypothetical protein [Sphingomonas xinjiangensis]|uniref:Uncharacterized protein n=1 Tax=Sphingomonas xinjiangensis TaxID=643568 RepID=A0A840YPD0_9SPHN|nr:hypothetical protein [Sphingomonas xinjiangensis]MBB5709273.1 hypothetical protein [Sphingomonas xinjiangensis]